MWTTTQWLQVGTLVFFQKFAVSGGVGAVVIVPPGDEPLAATVDVDVPATSGQI